MADAETAAPERAAAPESGSNEVDSQEKTELPNPETVESSQKVNEEAVKKSAEPNKEADEPSETAPPKDPEDAEAQVADTQGKEEVTATTAETDESQHNEQGGVSEQGAVKAEGLNEGEEQVKEPEVAATPVEDETGPDIEIAHSEMKDESPLPRDDTMQDRDLPDAYSTPPPPEMEQYHDNDDDEYHDFFEGDRDQSDQGSSPEYPIFDRAQLIERYKEALEERSQLTNMNNQLQHKLAEYFKKKKTDERVQDVEKNVTDQEQRYLKYISNLEELQNEERRQEEEIKAQKEEMKQRCLERQGKVETASDEYLQFKYDIAKSAESSRSGKPIQPKDLEQYRSQELKKEEDVRQVRLENIKLKNKLRKKEQQLKAKEELAEGLHLIDFEQLKIENQTYNEKIEERNEEILKLRKKITTTVQVLTHLKEKLQFVQGENGEQRNTLKTIEATVAQKRDLLTRTKQVRDALRMENLKLKQKCGLLGNESLLRDFEERVDEGEDLAEKLQELKTDHAGLSMNLNGVKKKIRESRNLSST